MAFVTVARTAEIAPGQARRIEMDGTVFALFRVADAYYATQDTCCGRGGRLSEGSINAQRATVSCPLHSWEFDLATGQHPQSPFVRLRTYPVRIHGDEIQVDFTGQVGDGLFRPIP